MLAPGRSSRALTAIRTDAKRSSALDAACKCRPCSGRRQQCRLNACLDAPLELHNFTVSMSSGSNINWISLLSAVAPPPAPADGSPAPAPLPPEAYGTMYPPGPIVWLWIPVVLAAHCFAAYWLLQMLLLWRPGLGQRLKRRLLELRRSRRAASAAPDLGEPAAAEQGAGPAAAAAAYAAAARATPKVAPLHLQWINISRCCTSTDGSKRWLLQGAYGCAAPGEMQALLGPSGAGKSSLMDILAMRGAAAAAGRCADSGCVLVDGQPRGVSFLLSSAYVPQTENFVPTMTAEEALQFHAAVLLGPRGVGLQERAARVREVLRVMGLAGAAGTLVGGVLPGGLLLRGLSGGEVKRLGICCGLLAQPSLLFLDEPTTGLDSLAALTVMRHVRAVADAGASVLAAIHQPRPAIWELFDQALLLSQGLLLYQGPTAQLVPWFSGHLGYSYDPQQHGAAPDWVMDLVALGIAKPKACPGEGGMTSTQDLVSGALAFRRHYLRAHPEAAALAKSGPAEGPAPLQQLVVEDGAGAAQQQQQQQGVEDGAPAGADGSEGGSPAGAAAQQKQLPEVPELAALRRTGTDPPGQAAAATAGAKADGAASGGAARAVAQPAPHVHQQQGTPGSGGAGRGRGGLRRWLHQTRTLMRREVLIITRNPADVAGRMLIFTWVAIIAGLINYGTGGDRADRLALVVSGAYITMSFYMLMPYVFMSLFTSDKRFFLADTSARLYPASAYYVAKLLAALPFNVSIALSFILTIYGMVGMRKELVPALEMSAIAVLMSLIALQVLFCAAMLTPTQDSAFMLTILWTAVNLLVSNYFIRFADFALYWLTHLRYLSALNYAFQGFLRSDLRGRTYDCSDTSDPGMSAIGLYPQVLPATPELAPVRTVLLEQRGAGFLDGCIARGDAVLDYYGVGGSFGGTMGVLLAYLAVVYALGYFALANAARRASSRAGSGVR